MNPHSSKRSSDHTFVITILRNDPATIERLIERLIQHLDIKQTNSDLKIIGSAENIQTFSEKIEIYRIIVAEAKVLEREES